MPDRGFRPLPFVAGVSGAILCLEILFTRLFSAILHYHFTFVAVAMGMLGLSAAALEVTLKAHRIRPEEMPSLAAKSSLFFSLSIPFSLLVILGVPALFGGQPLLSLACYYAACLLPFYFGGRALALVFAFRAENFSQLYAADFIAAAVGCLLAAPFLVLYRGPGAVLAMAIVNLGFLYIAVGKGRIRAVAAGAIVVLLSALAVDGQAPFLNIYNPSMVGRPLLLEEWTPIARVSVHEAESSPWLQENLFDPLVTSQKMLILDARATTPIVPAAAAESRRQIALDLSASAYATTGRERALIIGAGGGRDLLVALASGFRHVDGVEINPSIVRLMSSGEFAEYSGNIYNHPQVKIHEMDGRRFVQESPYRYDNIQLTLVDTFASTTAGAFALSENNLYTVEAIESYIDHLSPDGVLAVSRWSGAESVRLFQLLREAARRRGITDVSKHLAVFVSALSPGASAQAAFFLFRKSAFDEGSVRKLREFSAAARLPLFHDPLEARPSRISEIIRAGEPLPTERYEQRASTDDWPFFFFRPARTYWKDIFSRPGDLFAVPEYTVLGVALLSLLLSGLILLMPLALGRHRAGLQAADARPLSYFAAIGTAFMFVELPWIQRTVLYFGYPTIAMVVVLVSLLLGCGLGALAVHRFPARFPRGGSGVAVLAAVMILATDQLHGFLFSRTMFWANLPKALLLSAFFLLLGAMLGALFPLGMSRIAQRPAQLSAWAWAVNGCCSVVGSSAAMLSALFLGFSATLQIGVALYLLAAAAFHFSFPGKMSLPGEAGKRV